ncbi:hypothetical protein BV25DRAFT_1828662 [Artomyces pyxidatus]|uniref:Uncharacterized protein n=1 Tax=Artomyces pyxidatus TaxID=48021 RepID=A0ACB8STW9_9AGAM|nr:hypothetical protein BV25DRAFT_1828662 [Artomyces pyxidatus]
MPGAPLKCACAWARRVLAASVADAYDAGSMTALSQYGHDATTISLSAEAMCPAQRPRASPGELSPMNARHRSTPFILVRSALMAACPLLSVWLAVA